MIISGITVSVSVFRIGMRTYVVMDAECTSLVKRQNVRWHYVNAWRSYSWDHSYSEMS